MQCPLIRPHTYRDHSPKKVIPNMDDPGQPKLPPHLRSSVPDNYTEMSDWVQRLRERYSADDLQNLSNEHRTFLLYGFMAVTDGLHPRDAILVEKHHENYVEFIFQKRKDKSDWEKEVVYKKMKEEIESLKAMCIHLQKQLSRLQSGQSPNKS